jgi:hypothetical protein
MDNVPELSPGGLCEAGTPGAWVQALRRMPRDHDHAS